MKRIKRLAAKLKSDAGESLAEVLISLLIAALAMTMLASAISSTVKVVNRSREATSAYYEEAEDLIDLSESTGTMTVSISSISGYGSDLNGSTLTVKYGIIEDASFGDISVIAYQLS